MQLFGRSSGTAPTILDLAILPLGPDDPETFGVEGKTSDRGTVQVLERSPRI